LNRGPRPTLRCPCSGRHLAEAFVYDAPPAGEVRFDLATAQYARAYDCCGLCGHWFGRHAIDLAALYERDYVDATYGSPAGMHARLEHVLALPPERSDNTGRVARLTAFAHARFGPATTRKRLLDVGAGIGVFPAAMKAAGWTVIAVEPDPRTTAHLRNAVGVEAHAVPVEKLASMQIEPVDAITFNKVLEHVEDPVTMLAAARPLLAAGGFVYVEVPDAEGAAVHGPGREEFFIEHHHVFSAASTVMMAERAGFATLAVERLREPSGKFTLRAFFEVAASS
jgi:2-polyprenyl-3-methyl-5-hydroxy-6-metoxy-1,4-benzoquinol methylase